MIVYIYSCYIIITLFTCYCNNRKKEGYIKHYYKLNKTYSGFMIAFLIVSIVVSLKSTVP